MPAVLVRALGLACAFALLFAAFAASAVAAPPPNDDFTMAEALSGDQIEEGADNFEASKQVGEPNHAGDPGGASVWFAWTAPRSQTVYAEACTDGWRALLGVYRGSSVNSLQPVAAARARSAGSSCARLSFRAISTVTYRFAVDGSTAGGPAETGGFDFEISALPLEPPANDAFANATTVNSTTYEHVYGKTDEATREPGEPGVGGDLAGASVWYRWTAPSSGPQQIFPCQASFRPVVGVYTGSSLASLTPVSAPVALDASLLSACQLGGQGGVVFNAVAGETYSIVVDGADGGWGQFVLRMLAVVPPFADVYPPGTYIYKLLRLRGRGISIQFGTGGNMPGDTFLCKLDREAFSPCKAPRKWRGLAPGRHRVAVIAVDAAGNRDATPAVRTFRMGGKKK